MGEIVEIVETTDDFEFDADKYQQKQVTQVSEVESKDFVFDFNGMTVNEKGEVTIVFNNDLTELKERWEELKREENRRRRNLQSTFDNIQSIDDLKSLFIIEVVQNG